MPHINYTKYKTEILARIDFLQSQEQSLIKKHLCEQKAKEIEKFFGKITPVYKKNIVFVGHVGAGKTTAICHMLGLTFDKQKEIKTLNKETGKKEVTGTKTVTKTVLSTASGRTTICEVKINLTNKNSIEIVNIDEDEVKGFIYDLADFYCTKAKIQAGHSDVDDDANSFMHSEYEQALCYMVGYPTTNWELTMQTIEDNLYDSNRVYEHFLQNFNIKERNQTIFDIDSSTDWEDQKEQIHDLFTKINYGRHPNVSLPKQIIVNIDKSNLNLPRDFDVETIIDTKGLNGDDILSRQDIVGYIYDYQSVCVFVSNFNACPEPYIAKFGDNAEFFNKWDFFKSKFCCLVTAREPEWSKVVIGGEQVDESKEAYDHKFKIVNSEFARQNKTNYWKNLIKTKSDGIYNSQVKFYDAISDSNFEILDFVNKVHSMYEQDIVTTLDGYKYFDTDMLLKGLFNSPFATNFRIDK